MKSILFLALSLLAINSQAHTYICLGADEGVVTVDGNPDPTKAVAPFAHLKGAELRLTEDSDKVMDTTTLTIKRSDSDIIVIVGRQGALTFQEGAAFIDCVQRSPQP